MDINTSISQNSMPNYITNQDQSGMKADSFEHNHNVSKNDDVFTHHLNIQHMLTTNIKKQKKHTEKAKVKNKTKNNSIILPFPLGKHEARHTLSSQQYSYMIELERIKLASLNKLIGSFVENSFSVLKETMMAEVRV